MACASENPARVAGLHHTGSIAIGKRADLLFLSDSLALCKTIVNGRVVHEAAS